MELTDVVEGASLKWTRVPDYWGFDEKFPQNRLPYVDEISALDMSDPAARLAALRSGKVDMLGTVGDSQVRSIDQMKSLDQTNPEINTWGYQFRSEHAFAPNNISTPPFNDIRVRRAMQMALDLETISETYFSGLADPTPQGFLNNAKQGIGTPFEEWHQPDVRGRGDGNQPDGRPDLRRSGSAGPVPLMALMGERVTAERAAAAAPKRPERRFFWVSG